MLILFVIVNFLSFMMMGIDKLKAKKRRWRISEARIFASAVFFGAFGVWLGMIIFKHKTSTTKFQIAIPMLMVLELVIMYYLIMKFGL